MYYESINNVICWNLQIPKSFEHIFSCIQPIVNFKNKRERERRASKTIKDTNFDLLGWERERHGRFMGVCAKYFLFVVFPRQKFPLHQVPTMDSRGTLFVIWWKNQAWRDGVSENLLPSNFTYGVEESYENNTTHTQIPSFAFSRRWG